MELKLRKFDMSTIPADKVVVMVGRRGTGKSWLVRDLMYLNQDIPAGVVISPTEVANHFFGKFVPGIFIYDEYAPRIIENVCKRQNEQVTTVEKQEKLYGSCNIDPRVFLILDDCMYDNKWTTDKNVRMIFMNGRHYKIFFVLTLQYALGMPPILRSQVDYVFILREPNVNNRKRLYENFAGIFPTFDVFCQVMDQCTTNNECLVINNTATSNKLEDLVFWYKAEPRPDFQACAPQFWAIHKQLDRAAAEGGGDDDDDGPDAFDSAALLQKKKGPMIAVKKSPNFWR